MQQSATTAQRHELRNDGKLVGQKSPLKLKEIWAIRIPLQVANRIRELALFDLVIDRTLRACDLVRLRVRDVAHGERVAGHRDATEDPAPRSIRDHRADPGDASEVDRSRPPRAGALSVSEQRTRFTAPQKVDKPAFCGLPNASWYAVRKSAPMEGVIPAPVNGGGRSR